MGLRPLARLAERLAAPGAGLLLDLDGTLVDSEPVHRAAYVEYFSSRGWTVEDDVVLLFSGRRAQEVFSSVDGPWTGQDPDELTDAVIDVLRRGRTKPLAVPGARELLEACARRGLPVAVVTSARLEWALPALDGLGASRGGRPPVVSAEDCRHGKPDPEPYRRGADLLGLDPAGLVAVEDATAGLASAAGAGIGLLVGLTTTLEPAGLADAHVLMDDLRPLVEAVERSAG